MSSAAAREGKVCQAVCCAVAAAGCIQTHAAARGPAKGGLLYCVLPHAGPTLVRRWWRYAFVPVCLPPQGSIEEVQYAHGPRSDYDSLDWEHNGHDQDNGASPLVVSRAGTLSADSVTMLGGSTIHSCVNDGDDPAFTLHVYSPPYTRASYYDVSTGTSVAVDIPTFAAAATELDAASRPPVHVHEESPGL